MRRRILWSIIGVSAVAVLVLGVPLAVAVDRLYRNDAILQLERDASEARRRINVTAISRSDRVELDNSGVTRFALYSRSAERIGGRGPARADQVVRGALHGNVRDGNVAGRTVVAIPVDGNEQIVGALRASRPETVVTDRIRRAWLVMGLVAAAALVIAAALARWQARRLTRPVEALVGSAERLGAGEFSVRTLRSGLAELDELGEAMDATAARLGDLLERERAFSADASHQLRTPVAALRVSIESTLMETDIDARTALNGLLEPIDRLETTVDELLHLARDTHRDRAPLDLATLVGDVDERWHGTFAAAGRRLRMQLDSESGTPRAAASAIGEIVDVLIANAYEHGAGSVVLRVRAAPNGTAIDVSDEGRPTAIASDVFARRDRPGRGIGLALARSLAEAEGARLVLDRGSMHTTFSLLFPTSST
ncbi:MAG: HAMP domain-containing sensor histidine kinase [Acidimicrobiia bacterium]